MKKTLLICGVLLAFAAPAFAQALPAQVDLSWSDCPLGVFTIDATNACTNNSASVGVMIASFVPHDVLPAYEANLSIIDLQTSAATLSPWWNMTATGCRAGLVLSSDFTAGPSSCSDYWGGQASNGMQYSTPSTSLGTPNSARIQTAVGLQNPGAGIDNLQMWYAYKLTLLRVKSVGLGACAGCLDGACIVINQMNLSQPPPAVDDVLTSGPQQYVTYRGGAGVSSPCPQSTPNRKSTWGSVKALYR